MNLRKQILHDWPDDSPVAGVCLRLVRALSAAPPVDHYSFYDLQQLIKATSREELAQALLYLSNPELRILRPSLLYEAREGEVLELPEAEVKQYISSGTVRNPDTGSPMDPSDVLVSFLPGDGLSHLSRRRAARQR